MSLKDLFAFGHDGRSGSQAGESAEDASDVLESLSEDEHVAEYLKLHKRTSDFVVDSAEAPRLGSDQAEADTAV